MYKGIFWLIPTENHYRLETVMAKCEMDGTCFDDVRFSSKSGENFNHETEWRILRQKIKDAHDFNYYPRGRVEIKNGKIRVFINADFNTEDIRNLILITFDLKAYEDDVRFISDGSNHYKYSSYDIFVNYPSSRDIENGVIYSYGTPSLVTRHHKSHYNTTPHSGQIPVSAEYFEEILGMGTICKFVGCLLPCIVYGPEHPRYKMYLLSTAMLLQDISRFVIKNENKLTKPAERIYEKELFTSMLETEDEIADRVAKYGDSDASAEYVFKCIEAMKPLIVRWLAADYEMLLVSEYAYLIDYVIKRKGDVPYPETGLFPKNYEDFKYWEGIGEEFAEFN